MTAQKFLALQEKLKRVSPEKRVHLISYLPESYRKEIENPLFPQNALRVEMTPEKMVRRIDTSHFKRYIDMLPKSEQHLFITAFPKYKQVDLTSRNAVYTEYKSKKLSRTILLSLFNELEDFPPPSMLPYHPTIELLSDTGVPLLKLISYLGLIDIAVEVKKIISKTTLKKLQAAFDKEQIAFINQIAKKENIPTLAPMNITSYDGEVELLNRLIQERGMYRFAQAIKDTPQEYRFFFHYFLPKTISDCLFSILKKRFNYAISYKGFEADTLTTWRFLCTYSP